MCAGGRPEKPDAPSAGGVPRHPEEKPIMTAAHTYALLLSDAERARYRLMAERASSEEAQLWQQAGIRPGARVADIGCGPGASMPTRTPCRPRAATWRCAISTMSTSDRGAPMTPGWPPGPWTW